MQELTISEYADELNLTYNGSVKNINKLIKLHNSNKIKFSEKISETGRKVKTVYIDTSLLSTLKQEHAFKGEPVQQVQPSENTPVQVEKQPVQLDLMEKLVNDVLDSKRQLIELSAKAGQVHYLTDNLMNKEKDAKHWQDQYFKVKFELEQVQKENLELKLKLGKKWWKINLM